MGHSHDHHHHGHHNHFHSSEMKQLSRAFIFGIVLNLSFVVVEAVAGFITNSLALITDAGHNLSDVAGLGLALFAFRLAKSKSDETFTYGYSKSTILAALVNATILLVAMGGVGYEAIHRLLKPQPTEGIVMAMVAGIGIVINTASALLFLRQKDDDLNAKGAYLHLAGDALISLGVVVAGIIINYTHWFWLDSALSLVIMLVIIYGTWGLLTDSIRLSLDAVPRNVDMQTVKEKLLHMQGVMGIHHIHVWALSTQTNAITAHLVISETLSATDEQSLKERIKHTLQHLNNLVCKEEEC
jgi:cobalt-zinc-cadmium efflux system protein